MTTTCLSHPGVPGIGRCAHCGRDFCEVCRVESITAERAYCSETCRDAQTLGPDPVGSDEDLVRGLQRPIRTGWSLWSRTLQPLVVHTLPIAAAIAAVLTTFGASAAQLLAGDGSLPPSAYAGCLAAFAFGSALVGVVLTREYTAFGPPNLYLWTLRRFVPWAVTWLLSVVIVVIGFLMLLVPGVIASLRLFWADEFALILEQGPLASLRASLRLTRGHLWDVFTFQFLLGFASYLIVIPSWLAYLLISFVASESGASGFTLGRFIEATLTLEVAFLTYGAVHAPELVHFYGMRASAGTPAPDSESA